MGQALAQRQKITLQESHKVVQDKFSRCDAPFSSFSITGLSGVGISRCSCSPVKIIHCTEKRNQPLGERHGAESWRFHLAGGLRQGINEFLFG